MAANFEDVVAALEALKTGLLQTVVTCPLAPITIPGITAADAFDANDCFGTIFEIDVPKHGILYSATFFDMDDEGTQVDLEIFRHSITQIASSGGWSPTDEDILKFITELAFVAFDDHDKSQTSELTNIGKAYTAPAGKLYIQAVCRSTPDIAANNMPRVQLQILSADPDFKER